MFWSYFCKKELRRSTHKHDHAREARTLKNQHRPIYKALRCQFYLYHSDKLPQPHQASRIQNRRCSLREQSNRNAFQAESKLRAVQNSGWTLLITNRPRWQLVWPTKKFSVRAEYVKCGDACFWNIVGMRDCLVDSGRCRGTIARFSHQSIWARWVPRWDWKFTKPLKHRHSG